MKRVVAECLANKHLGIYEADGFHSNLKCNKCGQKVLNRLKDAEGHTEMPLKQAQHFINCEELRRKAAKNPAPTDPVTEIV